MLCAEATFHLRPLRETLAGGNMNYKHRVGSDLSLSSMRFESDLKRLSGFACLLPATEAVGFSCWAATAT